ncbi:MAG: SDR family oxidoreductase [Candidatus Goldbacteria bacterium]|nr:SDR family oxidoreductase [Candidatus Goldiibacteriota bacterium]
MKTAVITGASSGIGKAAVFKFAKNGWKVFACMREVKNNIFEGIKNIECVEMDVSDAVSVKNAYEEICKISDTVDAVVNNAGYGLNGPFEAASAEQVQRQYDVNVFGLMNVTRIFLPLFRKQKFGIFINVSSVAGRTAFPFSSLYISSKWAVEGFSESLYLELKPFGIKVKLVEPGTVKTDFFTRSMVFAKEAGFEAYEEMYEKRNKTAKGNMGAALPEEIAGVIYRAACDKSGRLRYPAGKMAFVVLLLRKMLPDNIFLKLVGAVKK